MASREGFVYRGRSTEDVDQQANQSSSSYDKIIIDRFPTLKVEKGDHTFRVMPPTFNKTKEDKKKYGNHWGLKVFVHRNVGPKDGMYLCLDAMKGEECPICEFAKELESDGESEDAYQLRQQFLYLSWAVDREDESAGPQVWMVPWTLDRDIGLLCKDKRTNEVLLIDHPDEGYDVDFRREGKGLGTKYAGVRVARDQSAISDNSKRQNKWLSFVDENPLTSVLNFYEADYLEDKVKAKGGSDEDGDSKKKKKKAAAKDEDEEDEPKKKIKRTRVDEDEEDEPKKKKKPKDEDEEEDEPAPKKKKPKDEDEDEEEAPPKKKKKPVDEDEEEAEPPKKKRPAKDEDEDDTDNDEPPSKKKKPSKDEDEEEAEPPKKKKRPVDEDEEEDEPPKKKKKPVDEDEEDEDTSSSAKKAMKKKKPAEDEEEEDEPPPKKKKRPSDEEDD